MNRTNLRGIDLNLLTIFEAVYEEHSQIKAAERLGMTQPAVSHAVGRLRHLVGDHLFQGRSKGLVTTPRADAFYEQVHAALSVIREEFSQEELFDPAETQRTYSLALSYGGGALFGTGLHARFRDVAPQARLVIRTIDPEREIPTLLRERRLDVAFHHRSLMEDGPFEQVTFGVDEMVCILRANHPRIQGAPTLDELLKEEFVSFQGLLTHLGSADATPLLESIQARTTLEVPNSLFLPLAVGRSDCLAVTSRVMARGFSEVFGLRYERLPVALPKIQYVMIWHKAFSADAGHRWFRNQLMELAQELGIERVDDPDG